MSFAKSKVVMLICVLLVNSGMAPGPTPRLKPVACSLVANQALAVRPPSFPSLFLSGDQNISAATVRAAAHFGNQPRFSDGTNARVDEGRKKLVRTTRPSLTREKVVNSEGEWIRPVSGGSGYDEPPTDHFRRMYYSKLIESLSVPAGGLIADIGIGDRGSQIFHLAALQAGLHVVLLNLHVGTTSVPVFNKLTSQLENVVKNVDLEHSSVDAVLLLNLKSGVRGGLHIAYEKSKENMFLNGLNLIKDGGMIAVSCVFDLLSELNANVEWLTEDARKFGITLTRGPTLSRTVGGDPSVAFLRVIKPKIHRVEFLARAA